MSHFCFFSKIASKPRILRLCVQSVSVDCVHNFLVQSLSSENNTYVLYNVHVYCMWMWFVHCIYVLYIMTGCLSVYCVLLMCIVCVCRALFFTVPFVGGLQYWANYLRPG